METGKAAPTWLDTHLEGDERWAAGVPADAPPWLADAFDGLVTLTDDELTLQADAIDAADPTGDDVSVDVVDAGLDAAARADSVSGESSGVDVGEWLLDESGFVEADDVAFVVDDDALVALGAGPDDAAASVEASDVPNPVVEAAVPTLTDPFDLVDEQSRPSGGEVDAPDAAEVPATATATAPADDAAATGAHVVPADDITTRIEADVDDIVDVPGSSADIVEGAGTSDPSTDQAGADDVTVEPAAGDAVDDAAGVGSHLSDVFDLDPIATSASADLDGPAAIPAFEHVDDDVSSAGFESDDDDPWHDGPAEWVDD